MTSSIIVKLNRVRLKDGMRERASRKFKEFFATIQGKEKGFKGFIILENKEDSHETLVLTLWESKGDMDNYYSNTNKRLSSLVDEVKPMFEKMPERITYNVASLELSNYAQKLQSQYHFIDWSCFLATSWQLLCLLA